MIKKSNFRKKALIGSLLLMGIGGGYCYQNDVVAANELPQKIELRFDTETKEPVTTKTVVKNCEKKIQNKHLKLSLDKKVDIHKSGNYQIDLKIKKEGLFSKTKHIPTIVHYGDFSGPHITLLKNTIAYGSHPTNSELIKSVDKTDGVEKGHDVQLSGLKTNKMGKQTIYVRSKDHAGNQTEQMFEIQVVDDKKPTITGISDCTLTTEEAKNVDLRKGIVGTDEVDGDITKDISLSEAHCSSEVGTHTYTYCLKDHAGNQTQQQRTITVIPLKTQTDNMLQVAPVKDHSNQKQSKVSEAVNEEPSQSAPAIEDKLPAPTTSTLHFLGQSIPFVQCNGVGSAPASGCGTWTGTGLVNDGAPTHFIGHNPGDFSPVMNITVGTSITVVDSANQTRTYTVYEVLDVNDDGTNADNSSDDTWQRVIDDSGERISLQTCITDSVNRIVLAK